MAGKPGKRHRINDEQMLALLREHGSIQAATTAAGYCDKNWIRIRLRKMGLPPGLPGRPYSEVWNGGLA